MNSCQSDLQVGDSAKPFVQVSPLSTLESSFEALNAKKLDGNFIYLG